ncbi:MAG: hypothetical protein B6D63_00815 [Candidatus Latescibacteria bacterium 4484_7]|nr:MAG: hypothetical protein B6D63_00815 [Candidatus Latescibacteria bacterium 4484_7]
MRALKNLSFLLKVYFIVGGIILVIFALYYNNLLIKRMHEQSIDTTRLFSRFIAIELQRVEDKDRQNFIRDIRSAIRIPFVITDKEGRPIVWSRVGIPQLADSEYSRVLDFNPAKPNDELLKRVLEKAREFDRDNEPIAISTEGYPLVVHFGQSKLTRDLAIAPYIQVVVFVLFMLFGFFGFRSLKLSEQRSIWIGMAKETAHQLGTPLSSIMGWLSIMREERQSNRCSDRFDRALEEISTDIDRLSKISSRFSKIGSRPKLEYQELTPIIVNTVRYFERRMPALKKNSTISLDIEELPLIRCSKELLEWVFENLTKNALDAIEQGEGRINIRCRMNKEKGSIEILFSDNGKGMNPRMKKEIFSPGFTTKKRGWGLGLALVKRIIEDIHRGSIKVLHTQPGEGTTFFMSLPVD